MLQEHLVIELGSLEQCLTKDSQDNPVMTAAKGLDSAIDGWMARTDMFGASLKGAGSQTQCERSQA